MRLLGYSVDMFSMMAITLSIGFIVDDAIVMIENIVRHREMGKTRVQAARDGAGEVGFTIISMTVSLVAVFLPIVFLNGVLGRLLREFAVTISVSILISGLTALTLTPMLCSRFLASRQAAGNWFQQRSERLYAGMQEVYRRSLDIVLRPAHGHPGQRCDDRSYYLPIRRRPQELHAGGRRAKLPRNPRSLAR